MQGCASTVVKPFAMPTRFEYLIRNGKTDLPFCSLFRIILHNISMRRNLSIPSAVHGGSLVFDFL
jgi:hypothetical protein